MRLIVFLLLPLLLVACAHQGGQPIMTFSTAEALLVSSVRIGLPFALDQIEDESGRAEVVKHAQAGVLLADHVLAILANESGVTRSEIDGAIATFDSGLTRTERSVIQEGINVVLTFAREQLQPVEGTETVRLFRSLFSAARDVFESFAAEEPAALGIPAPEPAGEQIE